IAVEISGRDIQPNSVTRHEPIAGSPEIDLEAVDLSRLHEARVAASPIAAPPDAVLEMQGAPVREDVAETCHEVRVAPCRARVEDDPERPDDIDITRKRRSRIDEHVAPGLGRAH